MTWSDQPTVLQQLHLVPLVAAASGADSVVDRPREEMAAELNCNPSTLGVRIFRARALLLLMHGELTYSHDASLGELLTRVILPLTSPHEHSEHSPDRRH